ncbi:MAG: hypothetical protein R3B70_13260 [Polyangiaceae bacterium]
MTLRRDGAEMLERVRADPTIAGVPVVLLTADVRTSRKTVGQACQGFLTKPVMLPDLLATVERFAIP